MHKALIISMFALCSACILLESSPESVVGPEYRFTPEIPAERREIKSLLLNSTMHIQYSGEIDL
ncbi:MAG: hypothetical protein Q7J80_03050, partial [Anaerolineales bacterium]|nr:hypothetical protein [Anaerolineales bacterium]